MGKIFNIQHFCIDDGPGIRTTVFMSGCPMHCIWCHNPESAHINGDIFYYRQKCILCGRCAQLCNCHVIDGDKHIFNRANCTLCGKCCEIGCGALEMSAREYSLPELMTEVMKDRRFYDESGGGITFSGGEPMLQFDFLYEVLKEIKKEDLHVCLETAGYAPTENFERISKYVDTFLYDYKLSSEDDYEKYTGVSSKLILTNLDFLDRIGADIILRCTIIPGINDNDNHFAQIRKIAEKYDSISSVNLQGYHDMGNSKRMSLGKTPTMENISEVSSGNIKEYAARIASRKICNI